MNSSSDQRGGTAALRIAGFGLGVLGAVGGVAGWFTLAGQDSGVTTSSITTGGTAAASTLSLGQGPAHTHTGSA